MGFILFAISSFIGSPLCELGVLQSKLQCPFHIGYYG